jgi:hypothetical protein
VWEGRFVFGGIVIVYCGVGTGVQIEVIFCCMMCVIRFVGVGFLCVLCYG